MPIDFTVHDETTAPDEAAPMLAGARSRLGFVSTLAGVMAESPQLLAGYNAAYDAFMKTSLPLLARHTVLIAVSVENRCEYCVAAHCTMALRAKMPDDVLRALRAGRELPDPRLQAVAALAMALVRQRGWADDAQLQAFFDAGFDRRQALDVVLGVGVKTMSNYTNHLAHTPLDPAWRDQRWSAPELSDRPARG